MNFRNIFKIFNKTTLARYSMLLGLLSFLFLGFSSNKVLGSPVADFKIQRGCSTSGSGSVTLTAGSDYTAPSNNENAFIRMVGTRLSGMGWIGTGGNTGTQDVDDFTWYISDPDFSGGSVSFTRLGTTNTQRFCWEIIEYVGRVSGPNEMKVRAVDNATYTSTGLTVNGASVSGIVNDSDVVVFVTGQDNLDASTSRTGSSGLSTSSWISVSDTPQFTRESHNSDANHVSYAVVEFTGSNWSVQRVEHNFSAAGSAQTESISDVGSLSRAFTHAQFRGETDGLDEFGAEMWLSSTTQASFELQSGATSPSGKYGVLWIIANSETTAGYNMNVQHISGSRATADTSEGANNEEDEWTDSITAVGDTTQTSIMGESGRSAGSGNAVPRGWISLYLNSSSGVKLWQSDDGQPQSYRFDVVEWPKSESTIAVGWDYRKAVAITNSSGGTLTDYQVPIFLDTASLISGGKMESDCKDLRVTDDSDELLDYWIATSPASNTCNQSTTKIWVKMPSISTSGETIYIYYGNSSVVSQSDGNAVFMTFGDFSSGSSLPSGWVKTDVGTSGSATVGSGVLSLSNTNGADIYQTDYGATHAYYDATTNGSFIAETYITSQSNTDAWAKSGIIIENTIAAATSNGQAFISTTIGNGIAFQYQSTGTYTAADANSSGGSYTHPQFLQLKKDGSNQVSGFYGSNGTSWTQQGSTVTATGVSANQYVGLFTTPHNTGATGTATFTFFYTRKYSATEPSAGTPGTEESLTGITLSGSIYTDAGSTLLDCSTPRTVNLRVDGAGSFTSECSNTPANGSWSISGVEVTSGQVITVYLDDETEEGTTVLISDGSAVTDIDLYQDNVIVRDDVGSSITPDDLYTGDDSDDDIKYSVSAASNGNLTLDSGFELFVWNGDTFDSSGGSVTSPSMTVSGNMTLSGALDVNGPLVINNGAALVQGSNNNITVSGDFTIANGGTFTKDSGSGTITFDGDLTFTDNNTTKQDMGSVVIGASPDTTDLASDFSASSLTVSGGDVFNTNGYDVDIGTGGITIASTGTFNAVDDVETDETTINLEGSWTNDGVFIADQSSVIFDGSTSVNLDSGCSDETACGNEMFHNVILSKSSQSNAVTLTNNHLRIGNQFTVTTGTLVQGSYNVNIERGDLTTDAVGYWKMDEGSWNNDCSTATVMDSSGNGNNGIACPSSTGPTGNSVAARFGTGGDFDGANDYVSVANSGTLQVDDEYTISFWTKVDTIPGSVTGFISKGPIALSASGTEYFALTLSTDGKVLFFDGSFGNNTLSTTALNTTDWYHITLTKSLSGSITRLYINGVAEGTDTTLYSAATNTSAFEIGRYTFNAIPAYVDAKMDDVRMYNRALTQSEVASLYNYGPQPVLEWGFNEGTGTSTFDTSGTGNTGAITGSTSFTTGKYGTAARFTTNNTDRVGNDSPTNVPANNRPQSITYWYKVDSNPAGPDVAVNILGSGSSATQCGFRSSTVMCWKNGGTELVNATSPTANQWHHVVYTFDGTNHRLYVDGDFKETSTVAADSGTATNVEVGYNGDSTAEDWENGEVDEVRIYNYALTQAQITSIYNSPPGVISVEGTGSWSNTSTGDLILGGAFYNEGAVTFQGTTSACGETDAISITSTVSASQRSWTGASTGTYAFNDVSVQDQGGNAAITVYSGTNVSGNNSNFSFSDCPTVSNSVTVDTSVANTITVSVANRYDMVMKTNDTDDYMIFKDRAQNDSSPNSTYEFIGPYIREGGTQYMLRWHNSRTTTVLEASDVRVRIRVTGCFDTSGGSSCLTDGSTALSVSEDYTFTPDGMYVYNNTNFQASGVALDSSTAEDGYNWLMVDADVADDAFDGTLVYGNGESQSTRTTDGAFEDSNRYTTFQGTNSYQSAQISIARNGWFDMSGGTDDWYSDFANSGTIDRVHTRERGTTPIGVHLASWSFLLLDQASLDSQSEREAVFSDYQNPDSLTYTVGDDWNDQVPTETGLQFDGSDDFVLVPNDASFPSGSAISVEAWVMYTGTVSDYIAILHRQYSTSDSEDYFLGLDPYAGTGRWVFLVRNSSGSQVLSYDDTNMVKNVWYHLAGTWDGTNVRMYVNGRLTDTDALSGSFAANTNPITLGSGTGSFGHDNFFPGKMDEVRLWSTTRTADDIRENMYRQVDPSTAGLSGYWQMNEGTYQYVHDVTSNTNDGTLGSNNTSEGSDPTWTSGYIDDPFNSGEGSYTLQTNPKSPGLYFNGTNTDYVTVADHASLRPTNITIEAWVYPTSVTGFHNIIYKGWYANGAWNLYMDGSDFYFSMLNSGGSQYNAAFTSAFTINRWHHIAATFDGTTSKVFVNGVQGGTTGTVSGSGFLQHTGSLYFSDDGGSPFAGRIDEIRFWNDDRTQAAIQADMYQEVDTSASGLVGYWKLNDNTGSSAADATGNGRTGTVNGADWTIGEVPLGSYNSLGVDIDGQANATTLLNGALSAGSTSITVDSTTGFAASGIAFIDGDKFSYTGLSGGTTFTGVPSTGTNAVQYHADNTLVASQSRFNPNFKISNYRQNTLQLAQLESSGLVEGTDYNMGFKPVTDADFYNNTGTTYTQLASGGDTSSANEYLYDDGMDYTLNFNEATDYLYLSSDSRFTGVNTALSTAGAGSSPTMTWQYCSANTDPNSACDTWSTLPVFDTDFGAKNFTASGNFYFDAPYNWARAQVNSGPTLYYIRGNLSAGSFSTAPIEDTITTDIVILHLASSISSADQTLEFSNAGNAPDTPTSLAQKTTGDVTLSTGEWTNESSVKFTASVSDTDPTDTLYLCVEIKALGVSFTDTETGCGSGAAYSGSPVSASVTIGSLSDGVEYHWQARTKDDAGQYSSWQAYGGNAESARDVGVDTSAPTGGTVNDGLSTDIAFNDGSLSSLSANWSGFNFDASGIQEYEYSIGTTAAGTDVLTWTTNGTSTSVTANSLTLRTTQMYFMNVRAKDNADNTSVVSSNGQLVAPSLSFHLSASNFAFEVLSSANGYSDTATSTLTTSTNAFNGYVIKLFKTTTLQRPGNPSITIPDFSVGTWSSPSAWGSGDYGFGYTSDDSSVQGSNRFGSTPCPAGGDPPCYAPVTSTSPGDIVADYVGMVTGSPRSNDQYVITYKVQTTSSQNAGLYNTTLVYTVIPQY